ncbi:MAG: hypothetical protein AAB468_02235 [Patescibacteria group bacterium]
MHKLFLLMADSPRIRGLFGEIGHLIQRCGHESDFLDQEDQIESRMSNADAAVIGWSSEPTIREQKCLDRAFRFGRPVGIVLETWQRRRLRSFGRQHLEHLHWVGLLPPLDYKIMTGVVNSRDLFRLELNVPDDHELLAVIESRYDDFGKRRAIILGAVDKVNSRRDKCLFHPVFSGANLHGFLETDLVNAADFALIDGSRPEIIVWAIYNCPDLPMAINEYQPDLIPFSEFNLGRELDLTRDDASYDVESFLLNPRRTDKCWQNVVGERNEFRCALDCAKSPEILARHVLGLPAVLPSPVDV